MKSFERIQRRLSRRTMVLGGSIAGLGVLTGNIPVIHTLAQTNPELQTTIDVASTMEMLAVTLLGVARYRGQRLGFDDADVRFLRAAQCENEAHYHFLEAAGATPTTTTFSIANAIFADRETFYQHLIDIQAIFVGGYMAATRQFAAMGDWRLVEIAYQMGTVAAQHQTVAKMLLGDPQPVDRAFPAWMFYDISEALTALANIGYIDGSGKKYDFPGPVDRFCRGVFGLVPETTDDQQPAPDSLTVPVATPVS